MRKLPVRQRPARKLLGAIIAVALLLPGTGYTLGLGEIEVNSALNQRLNADIKLLSATPEETEALIVKLASREAFSRAGLDRPFLLNDLKFEAIEINGSSYIRVSSSKPIREPFLNFLVEIDWPNGRLLREYTVLLDPPVFMTQQTRTARNITSPSNNISSRPAAGSRNNAALKVTTATTASPRPVSLARTTAQAAETVNQASRVSAPAVQPQRIINQPAASYRIQAGDTAWRLADTMRPDQSVTVEQMMIALLRENQSSFINGNINGLKRGFILRVPDYEQITSTSHNDAALLVREQSALWRQYKQAKASAQPVSAIQAKAAADATDKAESSDEGAYLEIVTAGTGRSIASGKDPVDMSAQELRAELALARERAETGLVEKEALQQHIDTLRQNVEKMKGLLAIEGVGLRQGAVENRAETVADELAMSAADVNAQEKNLAETLPGEADKQLAEDALFVDETQANNALAEENNALATAGQAESAATQPQHEPRERADHLFTPLLNNPMWLAAAGGGLLLFTALIGLIVKRRKAAAAIGEESTEAVTAKNELDDLENLADDLADEVDDAKKVALASVTDEVGVDAAEAASTSIEDSIDQPVAAESEIAAEEPADDIIAEADVYLAYGIYQQAEELLTQAIVDHPERDDYRVKLAETHYASKNAGAFVSIASDIKQRTTDENSSAWKKVSAMGRDLCPDNPLFVSGIVGGLAAGSLSTNSSEQAFDLNLDGASDNSSDLNAGKDEISLELPELDAEVVSAMDELEFDLSDIDDIEETANLDEEFSLDIDVTELDIDKKDGTVAVEENFELDALDINLDELADVISADTSEKALAEVVDDDIVLDLTDEVDLLDSELNEIAANDEHKEASAENTELEPASEIVHDFGDEEDFDLSKLDDVDEVSTRLDLARAYLDMGDHEGSKSILQEVLTDGDDEQKKEASELIEKMG